MSNDVLEEIGLATVADRLRAARIRRRLTQLELAERIGVNQGDVAGWEAGRLPRRDRCVSIAETLNVSLDHLLLGRPFRELDR